MQYSQRIACSLEKEGFRGYFYSGWKETNKAIISVGGASCDEKTSIAMSGFLRKEGYNVLVLGFYLWKGLSKNLASIPIDYVEKAVHWLQNEQGIEKIAMTGASTGAGYTLVCASRCLQMRMELANRICKIRKLNLRMCKKLSEKCFVDKRMLCYYGERGKAMYE